MQYKEMPVSDRCKEILEKKEHVLVGISPLNSYFSEENIKKLIYWSHANFKDFHLILPDTLTYFNFLALGYSENKALSKARRQIQYLLNKITKAFYSLALDKVYTNKVLKIGQFSNHSGYCSLHNDCLARYANDQVFRKNCLDASKLVLQHYTTSVSGDISSFTFDMSTRYLLGELPFYLDTPKILGIDSSLFVYHKAVTFFTNLYIDRKENMVSNEQGHLILEIG